jgi:adenine-specific DNA-methyltransferase
MPFLGRSLKGAWNPCAPRSTPRWARRGTEWEIPRFAETPWREKADVEIFWAIRHRTDLDRQQGLMALNHNRKTRFTLETLPERPADPWPAHAADLHAQWWQQRIARQKEIDA